jgi:hypothetical protein
MNYQFTNKKPVLISWDEVSGNSFTLQRGDGTVDGWSTIYSGANTYFLDVDAVQGVPYVYRVNSDLDSNWTSLNLGIPVDVPTNFNVQVNANGGLDVNFDYVPGLTYNIRRSTNGGIYSALASGLTVGLYHDANVTVGQRYWYKITAVSWLNESTNVTSQPSNPFSQIA